MKPQTHILEAMLHCPYKAWQLLKQEAPEYTTSNPVVVLAQQIGGQLSPNGPTSLKLLKQAETLLNDTTELLRKDQSPVFYKVPHCTECQFKDNCYKKLRDKDCISLLAGMTPKAMAKYHNKGITTITQLSYLFKPRRRRAPNPQSSYLWELKTLAIREQKTFVIEPPTFPYSPVAIYVDFEGTSDENHIYLIGALIIKDGQPDENFSFWSNHKEQQENNFTNLFNVFHQYPDAPICHYGSYESKVLRLAAKKWAKSLKQWPAIEKRMVNILAYLRTHVYPPIYGNGLKELGAYLDFHWSDPEANSFLSMAWRKEWNDSGLVEWKEKLIRYNMDDCIALCHVHRWFKQLGADVAPEKVQQVAQMKKHTPYHLQHNKDYGDDFQHISKAAYFDYQRNKVYWRNELKYWLGGDQKAGTRFYRMATEKS